MEVITVNVKGLSASFRRVLDYNYHRTYPLPPPTTIFGFLGAALGLSTEDLWSTDNIINETKVSVLSMNVPGFAKDQWTIQKISGGKIKGPSPYFRELLFFPEFTLIFGGSEEILCSIENAMRNPVFPLSMGREDELVRVIDVKRVLLRTGENLFTGTILPFDIKIRGFSPVLSEGLSIDPPIVDRIPIKFTLDKKGVRKPLDKQEFTFVPSTLTIAVNDDPNYDVYSIGGRNFVWLN